MKKLSHKQIASMGGHALKAKYPLEVRLKWIKKASEAAKEKRKQKTDGN